MSKKGFTFNDQYCEWNLTEFPILYVTISTSLGKKYL